MTRSEVWRHSYRTRRYLAYLTESELAERYADILTNQITLTPQGQLGFAGIGEATQFPWMELGTHVMEEYALREQDLPRVRHPRTYFPRPTYPQGASGFTALQSRGIDITGKLVRYGESWLEDTFKTGRWKISPASTYAEDKLGYAKQDVETELLFNVPDFVKSDETTASVPKGVWKGRAYSDSNYYMACLARSYRYRLFQDFNYNTAMIVMDEALFKERMLEAFDASRPGWLGSGAPVEYIDPHLPHKQPEIYFAKHFRYAYQDEFRFVWIPPKPLLTLNPMFIELGPLTDCCELIRLGDT